MGGKGAKERRKLARENGSTNHKSTNSNENLCSTIAAVSTRPIPTPTDPKKDKLNGLRGPETDHIVRIRRRRGRRDGSGRTDRTKIATSFHKQTNQNHEAHGKAEAKDPNCVKEEKAGKGREHLNNLNTKNKSFNTSKNKTRKVKKKSNKPKHLARKMARTDLSEKERLELESQAAKLEAMKRKNSVKFKLLVRRKVGEDKFDEETFDRLVKNGAKSSAIFEAVCLKEGSRGKGISTKSDRVAEDSDKSDFTKPLSNESNTKSEGDGKNEVFHKKGKNSSAFPTFNLDPKRIISSASSPEKNVTENEEQAGENGISFEKSKISLISSPLSPEKNAGELSERNSSSDVEDFQFENEINTEDVTGRRSRGRGKKRKKMEPKSPTKIEKVEIENSQAQDRKLNGSYDQSCDINEHVKEKNKNIIESENTHHKKAEKNSKSPNKITDKSNNGNKNKNRRCIGRHALTDFIVGQSYDGKVVYVKSTLGAFIDIKCHVDVFVHISNLSDDFIPAPIPESLIKENDEVKVRIVSIDRANKKLTGTLKSEGKTFRKEGNRTIFLNDDNGGEYDAVNSGKEPFKVGSTLQKKSQNNAVGTSIPVLAAGKTLEVVSQFPDESKMTPSELKRARKIARRAMRRQQQMET